MCKSANCHKRFNKSKSLTSHLAQHRAEKRWEKEEKQAKIEEEQELNGRFICEFPGCDKSYGKKHHLKEHERKHTGKALYYQIQKVSVVCIYETRLHITQSNGLQKCRLSILL